MKDYRVWALFVIYAACFGIELTINNIAALYYMDYFDLGIKTAGLVAGLFGLMNIFARTLGGFISDRFVQTGGLQGRVRWLFIALLVEGVALIFFSQMRVIALAIPVMIVFSLFVQMSEGATYSIVPFINKKALGSVAGIVGAGGNMGAVAAGFLFRSENDHLSAGAADPGIPGGRLLACCTFLVRFPRRRTRRPRPKEHSDWRWRTGARRWRTACRFGISSPASSTSGRWMPCASTSAIALVIKGVYYIANMSELELTLGGRAWGRNRRSLPGRSSSRTSSAAHALALGLRLPGGGRCANALVHHGGCRLRPPGGKRRRRASSART